MPRTSVAEGRKSGSVTGKDLCVCMCENPYQTSQPRKMQRQSKTRRTKERVRHTLYIEVQEKCEQKKERQETK